MTTTTTASDRKGLPGWTGEHDWTGLEASFARGCGDATILIANRKMSGKPCTADYLAALLDLAEQQSAHGPTYWAGFCTLVRICQARLDRMAPAA